MGMLNYQHGGAQSIAMLIFQHSGTLQKQGGLAFRLGGRAGYRGFAGGGRSEGVEFGAEFVEFFAHAKGAFLVGADAGAEAFLKLVDGAEGGAGVDLGVDFVNGGNLFHAVEGLVLQEDDDDEEGDDEPLYHKRFLSGGICGSVSGAGG